MADNISTVIGKDCVFSGTAEVTGSLRVDGSIKGEIKSKETVVIGSTGVVEGDITAKLAVISGRIVGNVHATEKIELQNKAILQGDLQTKSLVIEEGAVFEGASRMKEGSPQQKKELSK